MIGWGTLFSLWAITLGGILIVTSVAWHRWWMSPTDLSIVVGLSCALVIHTAMPVVRRKR